MARQNTRNTLLRRKALLLILLCMLTALQSSAYRFSYDFNGMPMSKAIVRISKEHPDVNISFIYKDLDNYKAAPRVRADDPYEALRQTIGLNPVTVVAQNGNYYIEARQHGRFRFTGRAVATDNEPVAGTTVMILTPKDSAVITYGIADRDGRFDIPCDRRDVIARLSCVGYRTIYRKCSHLNLGDIIMPANTVVLGQIDVKAERTNIESDRTVFIPGKREKNAAHDGIGLLRTMAIPLLIIDPMSKTVTTDTGDGVAFFIDFLQADDNQMARIRTQDVRRVEVYDFPSDPRFQGALHVVNFIMASYEYGGYSKVNLSQKIPEPDGSFSANSKFTYRRMTFDAEAGYAYSRDNSATSEGETTYRFPMQTIIRGSEILDNSSHGNSEYATLRATFSSDRCLISNTAGYQGDGTRTRTRTENRYTPAIYPKETAAMRDASRSNSATWKGTYQFFLPGDLMLNVSPTLRYSHHRNIYTWLETPLQIDNTAVQDAWAGNIGINARKSWGSQSLSFNAFGEFSDNRLRYYGTNPDRIDNNSAAAGIGVSGRLSAGQFTFSPSARVYYSHTRFGSEDYNDVLPAYYMEIGWQLHRKHKLELSSEMSNWTFGVADRSSNIVVRNMLDAVTGNTSLRPYLYNSVSLRYQCNAQKGLFTSAWCKYERWTRPMTYLYAPAEIDGREMMLRSLIKDGYYQQLQYGMSASLNLLDNNLNLWGQATGRYCRRGGINRYSGNFFRGSAGASYYLGNFYFSAWYNSPYRGMTMMACDSRSPWNYGMEAGWGKDGLNVSLSGNNILRTSRKGAYSRFDYDAYSTWSQSYSRDYTSAVTLQISYSISYGRKMRIESGPGKTGAISSGILK